MLQMRFSKNDPRFYSADRDIAHNFADVVRIVAERLEGRVWAPANAVLEANGLTEDDLGKACEAFCLFVASTTDEPKERMHETLERSGWNAVPEVAQLVYLGYLGTVMMGYYWSGARHATIGGEGPTNTAQDLRDKGRLAARLLSVPRWRRGFYRLRLRVGAILSAIRGKR